MATLFPDALARQNWDWSELPPDPVIEAYKRDVDRTLLRRNLDLTIEQRFEEMMQLQRFAEELRRAGSKMR